MKILYLNNYMNNEIMRLRNNENIYSQAANNKILGIYNSLISNGIEVEIISTGIVNNKSFKYYKTFISNDEYKVVFSGIMDIPLVNTLSSIFFTLKNIRKKIKEQEINSIVFYNYKPEVAFAAYLAKKLYRIPIIVEYEDGYGAVEGLGTLKSAMLKLTEQVVSKAIDGAILVNSKIDIGNVPKSIIRGVANETLLKKCSIDRIQEYKKIKLAFTSGLDEERGIKVLIESLKYTKEDFELIITGRGPLEQLVRDSSDKRVKYLGFLPYEEINNVLLSSHILINAQLSSHSFGQMSFPSKIFEYISTGNSIISSEVSDILDFHRGLFYIYKSDNPVELAKMIDKAINDLKNRNIRRDDILKLARENTPTEVGKRVKLDLLDNIGLIN